jgi:threonine synthase
VFVTGLRCLRCGTPYPPSPMAYTCPLCGPGDDTTDPGVLDVQYDYAAARRALIRCGRVDSPRHDLFRYLPLLPVDSPGAGLPAGGTPLVPAPRLAARLGLQALHLKDETRNPTRCLKDRATAVAVTMARRLARTDLYCASAGNAAISLAGYCAHLGLGCHAFVPREASATRLAWLRRYGADVRISTGNYDQAYHEAETAGAAHGWYSRNCAFNPYLVEGKKTAALETAEQLNWEIPDVVVAPVGDGCTLGALGKGFRELATLGLTERLPRLVGVQAEAIQPLVRRHRVVAAGAVGDDGEADGATMAASIAVRRPRNALRLLKELALSDGIMMAAPDEEIAAAQRSLATEAGVVAEFTSAATLAGLLRLVQAESLAGKCAVLVITGGRLDEDL